MHQTHWMAVCSDCDKKWYSKNALGLAAIHNKKTGHEVYKRYRELTLAMLASK